MHEQGIIGYSAFKNGVGIRIFLNRAASSVGVRPDSGEQKILRFPHASAGATPTSESETTFKDEISENGLDQDNKSGAPKNGADIKPNDKKSHDPTSRPTYKPEASTKHEGREVEVIAPESNTLPMEEIIERLRREIEPCLKSAATQAAAQAAAREMASTREWFETKALPKAVRVAQSESYNLFRKYGTLGDKTQRARAELEVGRASESFTPPQARLQSEKEIMELAETCVAMHELQGKSIDVTLAEISSEGGGWLLPEDAPRVREAAQKLMQARNERR